MRKMFELSAFSSSFSLPDSLAQGKKDRNKMASHSFNGKT